MAATPQLDLALRKNHGERIRGDWIARLKAGCACEILPEPFLALEQTEALRKEFFVRVKSDKRLQRRQWPVSSLEELEVLGDVILLSIGLIALRGQPIFD